MSEMEQELTADLLGPVPEVLLLGLFDETVDEEVVGLWCHMSVLTIRMLELLLTSSVKGMDRSSSASLHRCCFEKRV